MSGDSLRILAEQRLALGDAPGVLQIAKALKILDALDANLAGLKPLRVAVVSSFTFDPLVAPLRARAYLDGFRMEAHVAPFGQYAQQFIQPDSGLHRFQPDLILAAVRLQDACPEIYERFTGLDEPAASAAARGWLSQWTETLKAFRQLSSARLVCANYEMPCRPSLGLADPRSKPSQIALIAELNRGLIDLLDQIGNAQLLDVDALAARRGREGWTDPKLWFHARLPIAPAHHWAYAGEFVRMLRASTGRSRKVLALDCDDTLWGGILGEVGRDGIALGHDYPGNAFVAFQRRALELWRRGVVLAVASKNEHAAVLDVFQNHPDMILRPEHIAYFAVNWGPKPDNLRRAAETLNLGLDSLVFIDNDAVECAMMRDVLPEVLTVQLPGDPADYENALARLDVFDQMTVSEEDRARGTLYRQEAERAELKASAIDLESFYRQLDMRVTMSVNDTAIAARAAQLTQRTNQFNMTTVRRTESQIRELMTGGRHEVIALRLEDRFGDNGIVGLAIVERGSNDWMLDTLLMSCRVLGRTVEQAFVSWIARRATEAGASRLVGLYRATSKNGPFGDFYRAWGMTPGPADSGPAQAWNYELKPGDAGLAVPPWIELHETRNSKLET